MKDLKYLELKRKGIIDKDDNVQLNGEQVPYYFLNEDCTAFNPPTGTMPYQSDEWFYRFLKKHGHLNINTNSKSEIADEMFKLIDTGKYKKRNLIKIELRSLDKEDYGKYKYYPHEYAEFLIRLGKKFRLDIQQKVKAKKLYRS